MWIILGTTKLYRTRGPQQIWPVYILLNFFQTVFHYYVFKGIYEVLRSTESNAKKNWPSLLNFCKKKKRKKRRGSIYLFFWQMWKNCNIFTFFFILDQWNILTALVPGLLYCVTTPTPFFLNLTPSTLLHWMYTHTLFPQPYTVNLINSVIQPQPYSLILHHHPY